MSLLNELLKEEGGGTICQLLLDAASDVIAGKSPLRRNIDLNRFEVVIDGDTGCVEISDVLEDDVSEQVTLDDFRTTVEKAMEQLTSGLMERGG